MSQNRSHGLPRASVKLTERSLNRSLVLSHRLQNASSIKEIAKSHNPHIVEKNFHGKNIFVIVRMVCFLLGTTQRFIYWGVKFSLSI